MENVPTKKEPLGLRSGRSCWLRGADDEEEEEEELVAWRNW